MYYIKIIVNFKKTAPDPLYSVHRYVDIKQNGDDLNTYPANWINNWIIAYGVFRKKHHQLTLPPPPKKKKHNNNNKKTKTKTKKPYDYRTAFDIKPTKVIISGILLDESNVNSAATVEYVTSHWQVERVKKRKLKTIRVTFPPPCLRSNKMVNYLFQTAWSLATTTDCERHFHKTDTYRPITRPVIVQPDLSQGYNYTNFDKTSAASL